MFLFNIIHGKPIRDIEDPFNKNEKDKENKPEDVDDILLHSRGRALANALRRGDLNGDGKFDAEDLRILKDYLDGKEELNEEQLKEADFNDDGVVDDEDYRLFVLQYMEKGKLQDRIRDLQDLYMSLFMGHPSGIRVSGVDNSDITSVRLELQSAIERLAVLSTII